MIKTKMSVSLDEKSMILIQEAVNSKMFRNRSHAVEHAIRQTFTEE